MDFTLLQGLGWGNDFTQQLDLEQLDSVRPARVINVGRDHYRVDAGNGPILATLSGHFRYEHHGDADYPTVGDWVLLHESEAVITERLERRNLISRRGAGSTDVQALAANIDLLIITAGLDHEFNLHRIERYLVMAAQAGVTPMVILTKADLCDEVEDRIASVQQRLPAGAEVMAVNALTEPMAERLAHWLTPGTSIVVIGSSGVGKSTLINNLAGQSLQATAATRSDSKGRHTTTSRDLIRLPGGACIIDVPGMREVGLAPTEGGVSRQFNSLTELAQHCRFSDCTHENEPGCAVRDAVECGEVDPDEWQHYLKLRAEERHNIAEHEKRREGRIFGKMVREVKAIKKQNRDA
ncbi:MAG: ribosome small subunit-dependent GTPase A [Gammaproteobacteria bacterium]|nr:ribosome small subunit-dependent GTPase A [Gammaproteobacteria bacterium]